jgi:hypothetical protein
MKINKNKTKLLFCGATMIATSISITCPLIITSCNNAKELSIE